MIASCMTAKAGGLDNAKGRRIQKRVVLICLPSYPTIREIIYRGYRFINLAAPKNGGIIILQADTAT